MFQEPIQNLLPTALHTEISTIVEIVVAICAVIGSYIGLKRYRKWVKDTDKEKGDQG